MEEGGEAPAEPKERLTFLKETGPSAIIPT